MKGQSRRTRSTAAETTMLRPRVRSLIAWMPLAALVAGGIWLGADRVPPDPHAVIEIHGEVGTIPAELPARFTFATFNIHRGKGPDGRVDLERTAAVLGRAKLAVLQEVAGTLNGNQAIPLAEAQSAVSVFVPTERQWGLDHLGNAVLSRAKFEGIHRIPLAGTRGKAFRTATLTRFRWSRETLSLLSVHVDSQDDRQRQLTAVIDLFLALEPPAILAGDLNTPVDDPMLATLLARDDVSASLPTEPTLAPVIDWVIARGATLSEPTHDWNDASDHPVVHVRVGPLPDIESNSD